MSESNSGGVTVLKIALGVCAGGCLFVVVSIGGCLTLTGKVAHDMHERELDQQRAARAQPLAEIPWSELDALYSVRASTTELQKEQAWANYQGKRVQFTGEVAEIDQTLGQLALNLKMNPDTFTYDLRIRLDPDQRDAAAKLRKGDTVTVTGVLDAWGTLLPITMTHGQLAPRP